MKALARLHKCAGLPEPSLCACVISTVLFSHEPAQIASSFFQQYHEKTCLMQKNKPAIKPQKLLRSLSLHV